MLKKINNKYIKATIAILSVFFSLTSANLGFASIENSPAGSWETVDDETGKIKSIVEITEANGIFSGKIIQLINPSEPDPKCTKCSGDKANQAIEGMVIIENVTQKGNKWSGGTILDPKKGKTYKVILHLNENFQELSVRGYVGIPSLGRTQTWYRVKK